jgi:hypothetical protein
MLYADNAKNEDENSIFYRTHITAGGMGAFVNGDARERKE